MITISLCMIVKNESQVLARCLDSLAGLMDEIIIVDTGSVDDTKAIAARYTDKVYDFVWQDDFSAARNFSFSKASMEYIYAPDADEYMDPENQKTFLDLKKVLLPEIEIVQMHYLTPDTHNTIQNTRSELRPKLFRRLRTFTWIDPIHETVRLDPVVFDSDIIIRHLPENAHEKRDFSIFEKSIKKTGHLSPRIVSMYEKELLKCGDFNDFMNAISYFEELYSQEITPEYSSILAHYYRLAGKTDDFFSVALKNIASAPCSEICCELGTYYLDKSCWEDALLFYTNALEETSPVLIAEASGIIPLSAIAKCYRLAASEEPSQSDEYSRLASLYEKKASEWKLPEDS